MHNKTLIIFKSKTGFTERYAKWISEELSGDMVSYERRKSISFDPYDVVIYGGGFYAGTIGGLRWFKEKMSKLKGKTIIVFATGATPSESPEIQNELRKNFTDDEWVKIKAFYMQGGLCYEKMGIGDRLLMAMFRKMLKKTEGESGALNMVQNSNDCATKDAIYPLVEYCNGKVKNPKKQGSSSMD